MHPFNFKIELNHCADGILGSDTCFFYEAADLDYKITLEHLSKQDGFQILDHRIDALKGLSPIWWVRFTYAGYEFAIDTNHHAAISAFFVDDQNCPSEILLTVLRHVIE